MSDDSRPVVTTLTPKQVRFREHYLASWNATEAARVAGYKHPNQQGPELLKNPQIAAAIAERLEDAAMSADEVLARLTKIARGDLGQYINEDGDLDLMRLKENGDGLLVHKYQRTKRVTRKDEHEDEMIERLNIELYPADNALTILARHHRLLTDQVDVTTKGQAIKGYANVSPDDWDDGAAATEDSQAV